MSTCAIAERANARRSMRAVLTLLIFCLLTPSLRTDAQELTATKEAVAVPAEFGESIRALVQTDATVVMRGDSRLEFWWVKSLPLDTAPEGRPCRGILLAGPGPCAGVPWRGRIAWPSARDWKSRTPPGVEGSNPSLSASALPW